jgi:N-succinyldiaminopimelate aminotransferase
MQQILAYETDLLEYGDVFDSSPVIAAKVAELKQAAKEELKQIEQMGGTVAAVESGYLKQQLVESNSRRVEAIERGEQVVVGVNRFVETEPSPLQAAAEAVLTGKGNQYPPPTGIPELRAAVARHQRRFYGLGYDPGTEVLITAGATEAIAAALLALLEPGDEVIAFEPYYDSYVAMIAMAGATRVPLTLSPPDFRPDLGKLEAAITSRTRLLLLNSPHNPTGMVLTAAETEAIAKIAIEHDLLVITDEAYEHLTFDRAHIPLATVDGMRERTVSIGSAGKTFSFTGWKVGWATGTPELVGAVRTVKQFLTYVSSGPFQYAVAQALDLPDRYFTGMADELKARRDLLAGGLKEIGFDVYRPDGTYFITTDIAALGEKDAMDFCLALPDRVGVVAIPSAVFYDDNPEAGRTMVRFAFCKRPPVLEEAIGRLAVLAGPRKAEG